MAVGKRVQPSTEAMEPLRGPEVGFAFCSLNLNVRMAFHATKRIDIVMPRLLLGYLLLEHIGDVAFKMPIPCLLNFPAVQGIAILSVYPQCVTRAGITQATPVPTTYSSKNIKVISSGPCPGRRLLG